MYQQYQTHYNMKRTLDLNNFFIANLIVSETNESHQVLLY
jgi:hypothetical protein